MDFGATSGGPVPFPPVGAFEEVDGFVAFQGGDGVEVVDSERGDFSRCPGDEGGFGYAVADDGGDTVDFFAVEFVAVAATGAVDTTRHTSHRYLPVGDRSTDMR